MLGIKDGIKFFISENLPARELSHAFLTRVGGVSAPPFDSLNLDDRDADEKENVEANRARVGAALGLPPERLVTLNQVHGCSVLYADDKYLSAPRRMDADAVVTSLPNVPIGILTADCLPILLYDPVKRVIGAAHAGWKGALERVGSKTVEAMAGRCGTTTSGVQAALGPYIGPCCYAVNDDVLDGFAASFGEGASGFFEKRGGRLYLDIGKAVVFDLAASGVKEANILSVSRCTSCDEGLFFSYRRDRGRTGRQMSVIMLKG